MERHQADFALGLIFFILHHQTDVLEEALQVFEIFEAGDKRT